MDVAPLLQTLLGGALAVAGGYVAVVVGERSRQQADQAERIRGVHRAVLADTRTYMIALLDVSMARAVPDKTVEEASNWEAAARAARIDLGYVGDAQLLTDYRRLTNELTAVDIARRLPVQQKETGLDVVQGYSDVRARLTRAFVSMELRLEEGKPLPILEDSQVQAVMDATPFHEHFAWPTEPSHAEPPSAR